MTCAISIRPSKELRNNYAQISKLSRQNPVAITVKGKEDTAKQDIRDISFWIAEQSKDISIAKRYYRNGVTGLCRYMNVFLDF